MFISLIRVILLIGVLVYIENLHYLITLAYFTMSKQVYCTAYLPTKLLNCFVINMTVLQPFLLLFGW